MKDNYFWRLYMNGAYTRDCCPEYLKADNFEKLKSGAVDRVSTHTDSVQGFLEKHDGTISRYILLDHMDWLSDQFFPLLESEWQAIVDRAAPTAADYAPISSTKSKSIMTVKSRKSVRC
jgi:S-adenosylmethionine-diacylglycerol 3-amino-3-carboxypropyl transferase